jgi:HlyD family secretion protein
MRRLIWLGTVVVLVAGGISAYFYVQSRGNTLKFRTAKVERGPLTAAVSATGNLNAVIIVQVGSQVSGQIKELLADFNSVVKKGQLIARIDPEIFEAQVNQAKADLDAAKAMALNQVAAVEKARADLESARAALVQGKALTVKSEAARNDAKRIAARNDELFRRTFIAQADRDTAQANHDQAVAQVESSQASERALAAAIQSAAAQLRVHEAMYVSAEAQVKNKAASLAQSQINLDHTRITAPVDGVVVSRSIDVGQTVAASLQAPVLFTIAQDLTKMQVETSVAEADIGRIKLDDRATFTVDAFPAETFAGNVMQIRKAALVVQNVVTYTVVVAVDNPAGRLLPGMTANVKLVFAEKLSVLKVANAALRFRPAGSGGGPTGPAAGGGAAQGGPRSGAPGGGAGGGADRTEAIRDRLVQTYKLDDAQQRKLDAILQESRGQFAGLQGLPEQERQTRIQKNREATRSKIREILTPDQRTRHDADAAAGAGSAGRSGRTLAGRVWVQAPDGKLQPVAVMLGISDGTSTEVASGDLKEGQEIVIGVAGAQGARPGSPPGGGASSGPRLRL